MISLGFTFSFSDVVTLDKNLPYKSSYIYVGDTGGDIVYLGSDGTPQWVNAAGLGYNPIATTRVLTSGTVNGTLRTTSAVGMVYCCAPTY